MDPTTAEALLELAERASAGATGPNAKESLEQLEQRSGDLQEAIAWFVDAGRTDEAIMETQHMAWPPDERPHDEHMLAELPVAMGSDEFGRARRLGRSMGPSDAVLLALGPRSG